MSLNVSRAQQRVPRLQELHRSQAAQAGRDGAAQLIASEFTTNATPDGRIEHVSCEQSRWAGQAQHAQHCQRSQAGQAGRDGAAELVAVKVPANAR